MAPADPRRKPAMLNRIVYIPARDGRDPCGIVIRGKANMRPSTIINATARELAAYFAGNGLGKVKEREEGEAGAPGHHYHVFFRDLRDMQGAGTQDSGTLEERVGTGSLEESTPSDPTRSCYVQIKRMKEERSTGYDRSQRNPDRDFAEAPTGKTTFLYYLRFNAPGTLRRPGDKGGGITVDKEASRGMRDAFMGYLRDQRA